MLKALRITFLGHNDLKSLKEAPFTYIAAHPPNRLVNNKGGKSGTGNP